MRRPQICVATLGGAVLLAGAALVPQAAGAASAAPGFSCVASAVSVRIPGSAAVEPVVAGTATGPCGDKDSSLGTRLPGGLAADAVAARTQESADGAVAAGGLTGLHVPFASLPVSLPAVTLPASLAQVTIPVGGTGPPLGSAASSAAGVTGAVAGAAGAAGSLAGNLPAVPVVPALPGLRTATSRALLDTLVGGLPAAALATLPSALTLDLRPALIGLLPALELPALDVLSFRSAFAYATARCSSGTAAFAGAQQVAGLRVLGQDVADGGSFDGSVPLLDTASIDPTKADLSQLALPGGLSLSDPVVGPVLTEAIRAVLRAIPPLSLPSTLARVVVTPGGQTKIADGVAQQALRAQVSIAGTEVLDLSIGRSAVRGACPRAAAFDAPSAALECTTRRLVLVDVLERGGRVKLIGAADQRYAGKTVALVFGATGHVVAHAKVAADGSFAATAPLPARRLRGTNAARYEARIGKERSLDLKLRRRMVLSAISSRAGKVTIAGRIVGPLGSPAKAITLTRRVSCRKSEVVARFKPRKDGRFHVTVKAPTGKGAAVYRLGTQVQRTRSNPKLFPTFTLPRAVDLA